MALEKTIQNSVAKQQQLQDALRKAAEETAPVREVENEPDDTGGTSAQ